MMKQILTIFFFALTCFGKAQTLREWTQQKKTQIEYLANQIAALQAYASYVEKGYSIAKKGLAAIELNKTSDFSLNNDYFRSLKNVNPKIKSYWKDADIIALQNQIIQTYNKQRKVLQQSNQLTQDETTYCSGVFANLLNGCSKITDQLKLLVTDGSLQMKDDERIKRIDGLYDDMKDKYVFVQHFWAEVNSLAIQRSSDANDVRTEKALMTNGQ
jgi:hypothetical protein